MLYTSHNLKDIWDYSQLVSKATSNPGPNPMF